MAERILVSYYKYIKDPKPSDTGLDEFLSGVKDGRWQDSVLHVRTLATKQERQTAKQKVPLVRVSGSFSGQTDASLRKHSGYIAIDLDDLENPNSVKELLAQDKYIYAAFISVSGTGLCLIFRIDTGKHNESFEGICSYLYDTYQLIVDHTGGNVSRARFVSYDPYLVSQTDALLFKKYPTRKKAQPRNAVLFVKSDFDSIIKQLYERGTNICEEYSEWVSCAYALISEFGEQGRDYFHTLSSLSAKYGTADAERQYSNCLKNYSESKPKSAHIGSIYWHAKQVGIDIYSTRTKEILRATTYQTKSGLPPASIAGYLQKFHDIPESESLPLITKAVEKHVQFASDNIIDDIVSYLHQYQLRKNTITRNIEAATVPIDDSVINSIFIDLRSLNDKITKDLVCSVIFSNRITQFNPIRDFLIETPCADTTCPNLNRLLDSITSDTPGYRKWITKWLVACIASAHGIYSPLTLVLAGERQGTGKTHWFRYLLPKRLRSLYAESKMDAGKDDEILMTKKWIIMDDEYGGKSKREYTRMKELTSKEWINVREPFGRVSVDLRRLSMFGGTSNGLQILSDPTGNRRVIPVNVISEIDRVLYNSTDKEELFRELYHLYNSGYDFTVLKSDILELNDNTDEFKMSTPEEELICAKIKPGNGNYGDWLTITDVIQYLIADTKFTNLSSIRVGMLLLNMKFIKKRVYAAEVGNTTTCYNCIKLVRGGSELPI